MEEGLIEYNPFLRKKYDHDPEMRVRPEDVSDSQSLSNYLNGNFDITESVAQRFDQIIREDESLQNADALRFIAFNLDLAAQVGYPQLDEYVFGGSAAGPELLHGRHVLNPFRLIGLAKYLAEKELEGEYVFSTQTRNKAKLERKLDMAQDLINIEGVEAEVDQNRIKFLSQADHVPVLSSDTQTQRQRLGLPIVVPDYDFMLRILRLPQEYYELSIAQESQLYTDDPRDLIELTLIEHLDAIYGPEIDIYNVFGIDRDY